MVKLEDYINTYYDGDISEFCKQNELFLNQTKSWIYGESHYVIDVDKERVLVDIENCLRLNAPR